MFGIYRKKAPENLQKSGFNISCLKKCVEQETLLNLLSIKQRGIEAFESFNRKQTIESILRVSPKWVKRPGPESDYSSMTDMSTIGHWVDRFHDAYIRQTELCLLKQQLHSKVITSDQKDFFPQNPSYGGGWRSRFDRDDS